MKRKSRYEGVPAELSPAAAPTYQDTPSASLEARHRAWERHSEALQAWFTGRREWAAEHGWPGGEDAMLLEEQAIVVPDEPWDGSGI